MYSDVCTHILKIQARFQLPGYLHLFSYSEGASEKWEPNAVSPVADPALQPLPEENSSPPKLEEPTIQKPTQEKDKNTSGNV